MWYNIQEDGYIYSQCCGNLKSWLVNEMETKDDVLLLSHTLKTKLTKKVTIVRINHGNRR
jgi:hypothetical protein